MILKHLCSAFTPKCLLAHIHLSPQNINKTTYTSLREHIYIINISLITLMCINNIFIIKYKIYLIWQS
jgi:hypothetical protein